MPRDASAARTSLCPALTWLGPCRQCRPGVIPSLRCNTKVTRDIRGKTPQCSVQFLKTALRTDLGDSIPSLWRSAGLVFKTTKPLGSRTTPRTYWLYCGVLNFNKSCRFQAAKSIKPSERSGRNDDSTAASYCRQFKSVTKIIIGQCSGRENVKITTSLEQACAVLSDRLMPRSFDHHVKRAGLEFIRIRGDQRLSPDPAIAPAICVDLTKIAAKCSRLPRCLLHISTIVAPIAPQPINQIFLI
jgi:hypothetical protein